jgi:molybdopterin molybdotransferase
MGAISSLGMEPIDMGSVPDDIEATTEALQNASDNADVIISAGGISVGEEDHVRHAVEQLGEVDFWRVAIKPGKPLAFGRVADIPFIGLPGNPASVFVTFVVLAKPFLLAAQGVESTEPVIAQARALFERSGESREVYLRGNLTTAEGQVCVDIHPNQSSGVLSSVTWGNVLVRQRAGEKIAHDDFVDVLPY